MDRAREPPEGALDKNRACAIMAPLVRPLDQNKESQVTQESTVPEFGPVERTILWEQVAEQLMTMLREKHLRPGDKLPPERELATMMQVSRPSLREALRALSMMNVLEVRQGAGTYVTSLEPELLVEHLDFVLSLDDSSLLELFEARKIVEIGIAGLAAQRITDEELAELEAGLARSQETLHHPVDFLQADEELHKAITQAARNPIVDHLLCQRKPALGQVAGHAAEAEIIAHHPRAGCHLEQVDDQLSLLQCVEHEGEIDADVVGVETDGDEVVHDAGQLRHDDADVLGALRHLHPQQSFRRHGVAEVIRH